MAGIRVICNYLDDIYYLRSLLTRSESYHVIRESDYIKEPKPSGYRSLHLIVEVPIVISEGDAPPAGGDPAAHHRDGHVGQSRARAALQVRARLLGGRCRALRLCSEAISEVDREMQDIYLGNEPEYHA